MYNKDTNTVTVLKHIRTTLNMVTNHRILPNIKNIVIGLHNLEEAMMKKSYLYAYSYIQGQMNNIKTEIKKSESQIKEQVAQLKKLQTLQYEIERESAKLQKLSKTSTEK